jgi:hypothetical protein
MKTQADRDYQAESDHRTMTQAAEITADRKRLAGVRRHHGKEQKKLALVQRSVLQAGRR